MQDATVGQRIATFNTFVCTRSSLTGEWRISGFYDPENAKKLLADLVQDYDDKQACLIQTHVACTEGEISQLLGA